MSERGGPLSRNPNICESCSSLADGLEDAHTSFVGDSDIVEPGPELNQHHPPIEDVGVDVTSTR
jgi:hypothetical protein